MAQVIEFPHPIGPISTAKAKVDAEAVGCKERWVVTLTVTRDPEVEGLPVEWRWDEMIGGEPVVVRAACIGLVPDPEAAERFREEVIDR